MEVILALAIAAIVMAMIAMLIDIYLSMSTAGRRQVEQAQLARALLNQIAEDIRSTVNYRPQDFSSIAALLSGGAGGGNSGEGSGNSDGGGSSGGGGNGGNANGGANQQSGGSATSGNSSNGKSSSNTSTGGKSGNASGGNNSATGGNSPGGNSAGQGGSGSAGSAAGSDSGGSSEEATTEQPSFIGDATSLQLDTSRVPRVDQYQQLLASRSGTVFDLPSDVKTVVYALGDPLEEGGLQASSVVGQALLRSMGDRSVVQYQASTGGGTATMGTDVLATEVTGLQFRYFDGTEWLDQWDSVEMNGPPVAVEIQVTLAAPASGGMFQQVSSVLSATTPTAVIETTYRQVVYLPAAKPAASDATAGGAP